MIKRIISIILCAIMVLGVSINVSADTIVFLPENYTVHEPYVIDTSIGKVTCGWIPYNSSTNNNGLNYVGGIYPHYHANLPGAWQTKPITSKFYIETPGTYKIWAQPFNSAPAAADDAKHVKVGITMGTNVVWDSKKFQNIDPKTPGFIWQQGNNTYNLEPGWYTLNLQIAYTSHACGLVVVTNDDSLVLDRNTTTFAALEPYTDIEKPEFSGTLSTEYVDQTSVKVNLPDATDAHLKEIAYYINGVKKEFTPGTHIFGDLTPLSNVALKAEAMDVLGNSVMVEDSVTLSKIEVADFAICDGLGNKIDDISDLSSLSEIKATANVKSYTGENVPVQIGIGIYDKNFERMIDFAWMDASANTVAGGIESDVLTLTEAVKSSPSDYAVRAFIWEKATEDGEVSSMPLSTEITLKEVE